jgi:hypothetical protein
VKEGVRRAKLSHNLAVNPKIKKERKKERSIKAGLKGNLEERQKLYKGKDE